VGGRAQQIYTPEERRWYDDIVFATDPSVMMSRHDLYMAILDLDMRTNRELLSGLVHPPSKVREQPDWEYIYCDGDQVVLANIRHPAARNLVDRARAGLLKYPDAFTKAFSRGAFLASPAVRGDPMEALAAFVEASRHAVRPEVYRHMYLLASQHAQIQRHVTAHFQRELGRRETVPWRRPRGMEVLESRRQLTLILAQALVPQNQRQRDMQQHSLNLARQLARQMQELGRFYGFQMESQ
jgi:hypothetical protein